MSFRIVLAALGGLLLLSGAPHPLALAPPAAAQDAPGAGRPAPPPDEPEGGPPAPLPAEPKDAVKKAIQAALKKWFDDEPSLPEKRNEAEVKADRAKAAGEIQKLVQDWNATIPPANCLRLVAWWKARLDETQPTENHGSGIRREDFTTRTGKFTFVVSIPGTYRGKGTEVYPLILTVIDKEADPKKVLPATYGKLLETHIVVAGLETNLKSARGMLDGLLYAYYNYRIDRDRVVVDGIGKGARFVEELAASDTSALQWNGAVFRSPAMTSALAGNLGLFPCAVLEPPSPSGPVSAAILTIKTQTRTEVVPCPAPGDEAALQRVRDWIAALPPRRVSDQKATYTMWFRSNRKDAWGFWFVVNQAVEGPPDQPTVRVKIARDPKRNLVDLECVNLAAGTLLLNDEVLDLDRPVVVRVNGIVVSREKAVRNPMLTFDAIGGWATTSLGPRNYFITAEVPFVVTGDARILKADRDAADEAIRIAQERQKKKEEEEKAAADAAKNPKPPEVPPPGPTPPANPGAVPGPEGPATAVEPAWGADYAASREAAKKDGKPLLVLFADAASPRQKAVDDALATAEVKAVLLRYACVRLATEGDAGKVARDLMAKSAGAPDAAAPYLAVLKAEDETVTGRLAAAPLKDEEVLPRVKELLGPPAPPVPSVNWMASYPEAVAASLKARLPLVVHFMGGPEAKGQKELAEALDKDPEARTLLAGMVCVRLLAAGDDDTAKKNQGILKDLLGPTNTAPVLGAFLFADEKTLPQILGNFDPVNVPEADFLPKLRRVLGEWAPRRAAPADPPKVDPAKTEPPKPDPAKADEKPGEKKDTPPAPPAPPPGGTPPKPEDPPKTDEPKK